MVDILADFAWSTISVAPSPATSGLTVHVQTGDGAKFPASGGFNVLMAPQGQPLLPNVELARASGVSGDVITFTSRGLSPTTALSVQTGWQISQPIDAALLIQIISLISGITDTGTARQTLHVPVLTPAACVSVTNQSSLSGLLTIDGYTLAAGDLVLLTGQSTTSQNGLWAAASGAWTRPTEFATGISVQGRVCAVLNGTTYANTMWVLDTATAGVTIGTTAQTWARPKPLKGDVTAVMVGLVTQSITSSATPTWNSDTANCFELDSLAVAVTSFTSGWSGTPSVNQTIEWIINDNGTSHALAWGTLFIPSANGTAWPTASPGSTSKRLKASGQWCAAQNAFELLGTL